MAISLYPAPTISIPSAKWERTVQIKSTQSWTAPADVTSVEVILCGGAGSGLDYSGFGNKAGTVQAGFGGGGPQNSAVNGAANGRVNSGGGGGSLANATNSQWTGNAAGGSGIVVVRYTRASVGG